MKVAAVIAALLLAALAVAWTGEECPPAPCESVQQCPLSCDVCWSGRCE